MATECRVWHLHRRGACCATGRRGHRRPGSRRSDGTEPRARPGTSAGWRRYRVRGGRRSWQTRRRASKIHRDGPNRGASRLKGTTTTMAIISSRILCQQAGVARPRRGPRGLPGELGAGSRLGRADLGSGDRPGLREELRRRRADGGHHRDPRGDPTGRARRASAESVQRLPGDAGRMAAGPPGRHPQDPRHDENLLHPDHPRTTAGSSRRSSTRPASSTRPPDPWKAAHAPGRSPTSMNPSPSTATPP